MHLRDLKKTALILSIVALAATIIYFGKSFLMPLTFGALLSTLLFPVYKWLAAKGINRIVAILASILLLVGFFAGMFFLLGWQVSELAKDAPQIEEQLTQRYDQVRAYISETFGISEAKQEELIEEQKSSAPGKINGMFSSFLSGLGGILTNTILTLVYIFLFLYYKDHIQRFLIRLAPTGKKDVALEIIGNSSRVTQKYLTGLALMIMTLWAMYGIGFSIAGVKSPIFFAILCGLLEIVPFIGNIIGTTLTLLVSVMQGGDTNVIIGILVTYGLVQFIQTYILEPLVVGAEVDINPLFTIIALVLGELVWGLPGMILAIPIMGVTKIICDHVPSLNPAGDLIGEAKKDRHKSKFGKKIKTLGQKVKSIFSSGSG